MKVWLPVAPPVLPARGLEAQAKVSVSFANDNCQPWGINDGIEPKSSGEQPAAFCHWWPHKGTAEWAQYTWKTPVRSAARRSTGSTTPVEAMPPARLVAHRIPGRRRLETCCGHRGLIP